MLKTKDCSTILIFLIAILMTGVACSEQTASTPAPEKYSYEWWGEELHSERTSSNLTWGDGSNWIDGKSHIHPELPLPVGEYVGDRLTCAQAEILTMVSFPPGYDIDTWHTRADAEDIADKWLLREIATLYGDEVVRDVSIQPQRLADDRNSFWDEVCGGSMR